jgi:hypothetical protein
MNQWNPWSLVPIGVSILLLCALIGWILRSVQKSRSEAKRDWSTIVKITITIVCGAGMAFAGCFGLISPINKGNDLESIFLAVAFGGLGFFLAGIIWGTALGIGQLFMALRKNSKYE